MDHLFGSRLYGVVGLLPQWTGAGGVSFNSLPWQAQTVLMDITFNYGSVPSKVLRDAIAAGATISPTNPNGTYSARFKLAQDIAHLSSNPSRMLSDATLLGGIVSGVALTPPTLKQATTVSANTSTYGFSVADATTQYALDPTGSTTYVLVANPGSPNFISIELPTDSAASYSVSYEIDTTWSAPQTAQPDQTLNLPANVIGLQVDLFDANGNPIPDPGNFAFYVTLANAGTFSGNVYDFNPATPSVTVTTSNSDVNLANNTATIIFAFSEAAVDFNLSDVTVAGGTLSNFSGSGTTYTATFTGSLNTDINDASVGVTVGSYHDSDGNAGDGGSTGGFAVDTVTPTVPAVDLDVTAGATLSANAANGVLAGASDPAASQPLSIVAVNGASGNVGHSVAGAYGTLTLNADGSYSYAATANSAALPDGGALDNFTFTVSDIIGNTATATLSILVASANDTFYVGTAGGAVTAGNGNSVIDGRAGNETIIAGNGPDVVFAGANDTITSEMSRHRHRRRQRHHRGRQWARQHFGRSEQPCDGGKRFRHGRGRRRAARSPWATAKTA